MNVVDTSSMSVEGRVRTRVLDSKTGRLLKETPWKKNLVLDQGLLGMGLSGTQADSLPNIMNFCSIGGSNSSNALASGAVTFTQTGPFVTASAGFFTAAMVGQLLKYGVGTGGAEYYIVAFTSSTLVQVDTNATVGATVGTVWAVNRTALVSPLYLSNTYQTNTGDCKTTYNATTLTHQRTYVFAAQSSIYTVNEVGWGRSNTTDICGRMVLPSSDVVAPTNFYVVQIQVAYTLTPNVQTSVPNVGANIDTSGTAMTDSIFGYSSIYPFGGTSDGSWDAISNNVGRSQFRMTTNAAWTQPTTMQSIAVSTGPWDIALGTNSTVPYNLFPRKRAQGCSFFISTSGPLVYGISLHTVSVPGIYTPSVGFSVKLTTPFLMPVGSFLGNVVFTTSFGRTLTN